VPALRLGDLPRHDVSSVFTEQQKTPSGFSPPEGVSCSLALGLHGTHLRRPPAQKGRQGKRVCPRQGGRQVRGGIQALHDADRVGQARGLVNPFFGGSSISVVVDSSSMAPTL